MPDQITLSPPAVQHPVQRAGNAAPQGLAGSGRRRALLTLRNAEVIVAIVTSPEQVSHRTSFLPFKGVNNHVQHQPCPLFLGGSMWCVVP